MTIGLGTMAFALLFEVPGILRLIFSNRGVFGFNAALQVVLALAIVVGGNVYSFYHFNRYDLTQDHVFTLDPTIRVSLPQLRGDTDIVIFQNGSPFGHRVRRRCHWPIGRRACKFNKKEHR